MGGLSQLATLHSTGNISAEGSVKQEQSRPQQHTWNSKLFVIFPAETTAAHSLHFKYRYADWGYRFPGSLNSKKRFEGVKQLLKGRPRIKRRPGLKSKSRSALHMYVQSMAIPERFSPPFSQSRNRALRVHL